jgi:unsaturated rhamnogalacturonyl hydrolase
MNFRMIHRFAIYRTFICFSFIFFGAFPAQAKPVVGLDCYHNNESSPHYTWSLTTIDGFSQFAGIILGLNADTASIKTVVDSAVLSKIQVFIIVDPDTTTEAPAPKYLTTDEINAIDSWVQRGGALMLLANNFGNCELSKMSELGSRFGIRFNADTYGTVYDLSPLPAHAFFNGCDTLYIKDISTLKLASPAQAAFTLGGKNLIATSTKGLGTVFAIGDPWLYNEYINRRDNFEAGSNVMSWLLTRLPTSQKHPKMENRRHADATVTQGVFLIDGKCIAPGVRTYTKGIFIHRGERGKKVTIQK